MTAPKELHEGIDQLSPKGLEELRLLLERHKLADERLRRVREFAEGWTPEEEAAFEAAMNRRVVLRRSNRD